MRFLDNMIAASFPQDYGVRYDILLIICSRYKSGFDKARRTPGASFNGAGLKRGIRIRQKMHAKARLPTLCEMHEAPQVKPVADAVNVPQAVFVSARQMDLVGAIGDSDSQYQKGPISYARRYMGRDRQVDATAAVFDAAELASACRTSSGGYCLSVSSQLMRRRR